jgi:hypothetical protein
MGNSGQLISLIKKGEKKVLLQEESFNDVINFRFIEEVEGPRVGQR